jgi:Copper amine oxidase N-terminal domain
MFFKKYKQLIAGIVIGSVVAGSGATYAALNATIVNYKFKFDGVSKSVPAGYSVLNYQGRTYVPARFVAENLGATVGWDGSTQTVLFTSAGNSPVDTPQKLPVNETSNGVTVSVKAVDVLSDRTVFHLTVTNNGTVPVSFADILSHEVVNGTQYNHTNSFDDPSLFDQTWNNQIEPGASQSGFVALPAISSGATSVKLYTEVQQNGGNYGVIDQTFNISLK